MPSAGSPMRATAPAAADGHRALLAADPLRPCVPRGGALHPPLLPARWRKPLSGSPTVAPADAPQHLHPPDSQEGPPFPNTAVLHREHPERRSFTVGEIVARASREALHTPLRPGVQV